MKARILALMAAVALPLAAPHFAGAQGTAFTYQGQLGISGVPANGGFDLRFGLYTNVSAGNLVYGYITNSATAVSNGLFTTTLDFGNVFNGTAYWLEIGVRTNGSAGAFTTLNPRQPITPAPYAIMSGSAGTLLGTLPASQLTGPLPASVLTGTYSNAVTFTNSSNNFIGNGAGLTGLATQTNYLLAVDTNIQYFATAGVFQILTFNRIIINGGWTYANGVFTATQTGSYLVQYHIHVQNGTSNAIITPGVRAVANSAVELLGSESTFGIEPAAIGELTKSFLVQLTAGQTLTLQIASNYASSSSSPDDYTYTSAYYGGFYPGATLTIVRIQ